MAIQIVESMVQLLGYLIHTSHDNSTPQTQYIESMLTNVKPTLLQGLVSAGNVVSD